MRFDLSEDQQEIQAAARELLAARSTFVRVREVAEREEAAPTGMPDLSAVTTTREDEALWKELGELGWTGLAVPEDHGGQGLGVIELAAIVEELGYAVAPVPFLGSVAAGLVLQHEGSAEQQEDWLPHLAAGGLRGAVTLTGDRAPVPGAAEGGLVVVAD
ncbi:acyl-CoA dehydrogenase family protein, partial [Patulibacter sp. S7RM1-6]